MQNKKRSRKNRKPIFSASFYTGPQTIIHIQNKDFFDINVIRLPSLQKIMTIQDRTTPIKSMVHQDIGLFPLIAAFAVLSWSLFLKSHRKVQNKEQFFEC